MDVDVQVDLKASSADDVVGDDDDDGDGDGDGDDVNCRVVVDTPFFKPVLLEGDGLELCSVES